MFAAKDELFTRPSGGYTIARSVRLRSSASAYFNRTPASSGSLTTWTWSAWVKRGSLSTSQQLFGLLTGGGSTQHLALFDSNNQLDFYQYNGSYVGRKYTNQVFRDIGGWYHLVLVWDTTNATAGNRVRVYVNGTQVTSFSSTTDPAQNTNGFINSSSYNHGIAMAPTTNAQYFDGYITEINFIDGQALTPSSFGSTNAITGVWQPAKYTGTYGTNGFYLNFSDNSSNTATTIGKDYSGNGNNWTPNNISVTSGITYDSMVDSPTVGATSSNYCVLNPLRSYSANTISNANLNVLFTDATSSRTTFSTFGITSGKWYFEMTVTATGGGYYPGVGVNTDLSFAPSGQSGDTASGYMYLSTGQKLSAGLASYGSSYTTNDVIGVSLDMDAGTITFYKNNTSQGQAYSGITGTAVPCFIGNASSSCAVNFGQRPFSYTPPTGFVALNTYNLPASTITNGAAYMAATLYTGNGSTQSMSNAVNGVSFQPDFVWAKSRSTTDANFVLDSVRGATINLYTNGTAAEFTQNTVTAFNSGGFSVGSQANGVNTNAATYIGWQWKAGTTSASNTNGSITSTVSAGATQGFSVVTYTGTGTSGQTVGHGLGVKPAFIIVKRRTGTGGWVCWHQSLTGGSEQDRYIYLDLTSASGTTSSYWGSGITSSTFGVWATGGDNNASGATLVAYCFAAVAGYSAFGSYTGNGSTDGPFVYTGFRPRFVMVKNTTNSAGATNWVMQDSSRNGYNPNKTLYANASSAEDSSAYFDILSNGFKVRDTFRDVNTSGDTYIYACFAESPFKTSLAR